LLRATTMNLHSCLMRQVHMLLQGARPGD
jgi:hypothetical protein